MTLRLPRLFFSVLFICTLAATPSAANNNARNLRTGSELANKVLSKVTDNTLSVEETFKAAAKEHNIASKTVYGYSNLNNGYYLIAGVFGENQNAHKFARALRQKNLSPSIFESPENKMHYVYLKHFAGWEEAIASCLTKVNGKYNDKVWILNVAENSNAKAAGTSIASVPEKAPIRQSYDHFIKTAKTRNIATRIVGGMSQLKDGYYAVAGVFGDSNNASRFVKQLASKQLNGHIVVHPETSLSYVYIAFSPDWKDVLSSAASKMGGKYKEKLWIMTIRNAPTVSSGDINSSENFEQAVLATNTPSPYLAKTARSTQKDSPNKKLLQKADQYFDKMWYAEAAEIYEQVLGSNKESYTYEILQKTGDSHYFNTNMERAFYWYDILYNTYKDEMSAENIFKYAHSLKGTGKYARAKRLMRLYDKKSKTAKGRYDINDPRISLKEKTLDNILNTDQEYKIKNIGTNTQYSDFSPMFYDKDKLVFASSMDSSFFSTRRYKWNNQPYLDLYVAKVNEESQEVKDAIKFSKKINTKYHEASVTFSPDNTTMYFTRNNYGKKLKRAENGDNNLKIYRSQKVNGEWKEAEELPFNSDDFSTGHPALSPDGKKLYFVSDRPGSLGETDIFVVDVLPNGNFSEPRNLGPEINTERKEMFPFVSDKKLYFSSNGHVGLGGLDIYEVAYDEENGFQEVINMGKPVNSNKDDFSYIVHEETQKGFFASNRRGGKGDDDIYSFVRLIPEEIIQTAIAGVVTELVSGEVMPEALVTLLDENNIKLKEVVSDKDGSFVFEDLDSDRKYAIKVTKGSYLDEETAITTLENETVRVALSMKKLEELIVLEEGIKKVKLDMIFFDFDKAYIRADAALELDKLVRVMEENPSMTIKIASHTDSRGPAVYNKYLSDRRAKATRTYIISKGIDPKRIISAIGYGEEKLLNGCDGTVRCSSEQHQLNRRSEFIIVDM